MSADPATAPPKGQYLIVTSRFNALVTERLAAGARRALQERGVPTGRIVEIQVPGAWELAPVIARALGSGRFRGAVACGAVIQGETAHFQHVSRAAIDSLARTQLETGLPVGLAVLTTDTLEQALNRAGGKSGNKGEEAALAVLDTAAVLETLSVGERPGA